MKTKPLFVILIVQLVPAIATVFKSEDIALASITMGSLKNFHIKSVSSLSKLRYIRGGDTNDNDNGEENKVAFVAPSQSSESSSNDNDKHVEDTADNPMKQLDALSISTTDTKDKINTITLIGLRDQLAVSAHKVSVITLNIAGRLKDRLGEASAKGTTAGKAMCQNLKDTCIRLSQKKLPTKCIKILKLDVALDGIGKVSDEAKKVWGLVMLFLVSDLLPLVLNLENNQLLTNLAVFGISLAGTSLGFHSFLYFVSVGFGVSIGLIAATTLVVFNTMSKNSIPILTNIQTSLTLLWALRLIIFLLCREYINWPQWHEKLAEVNHRAKAESKFSVWMGCAPFYALMTMPCIYRMREAVAGLSNDSWGLVGKIGVAMQCFGLVLESVADWQKASFKRRDGNRNKWCSEGLWKFSTHPNYLGEIIFWLGTYIGSIECYKTVFQWTACTVGLLFISFVVKGAVEQLGAKHLRNYGFSEDFLEFKRTHGVFGPSWRISKQSKQSLYI